MTPDTHDPLAGLESAAAALRTPPAPGSRIRTVRAVVGTLLVLVALGMAGYFWIFTATSEAVVSGRAVTIAAPIAGLVEALDLDVGDPVEPGQVLARIRNVRADLGRIEQLRSQRASLHNRLEAVRAEAANKMTDTRSQQAELDQQASFEERDVERQVQEAQAQLAALTASRARHEFDFRAQSSLLERGLASRSAVEHAREDLVVSGRAVEAQSSAVARLEDRRRAVRTGVFLGTVVPVQKARIQDLAIRLDDLDVSVRELTANIATVDAEIQFEEGQAGNLVEAALVSPVRGYVWKRAANSGQHVVVGAEVIELVDTATIQVEAYFHQRSQSEIRVGDVATIAPVGGRERIRGIVRWIGADGSAQASAVAPQWNPNKDTAMRVLLSISAPDQRLVWVGQRAKVAVSRAPAGGLNRIAMMSIFSGW